MPCGNSMLLTYPLFCNKCPPKAGCIEEILVEPLTMPPIHLKWLKRQESAHTKEIFVSLIP